MYYLGIDIASQTFTATAIRAPNDIIFFGQTFTNDAAGTQQLFTLLADRQITAANCRVIMEATGVYTEHVAHVCYHSGFPVHIEPPKKVKDAFYSKRKTDPVDSGQIAEYGYRFTDRLHPWHPKNVVIETLAVLLTLREGLTKSLTASQNARKAVKRRQKLHATAIDIYDGMIQELKAAIKTVDGEMKQTVKQNSRLAAQLANVMTIPGVGMLLAVNLAVITEGFEQHVEAKPLAAYIGIAPYAYASGTSVKRPATSDKAGPKRLRKLLHLAAMSCCEHNRGMKTYYTRKVAEGKPGKLILNNLSHKLLRIMCRVLTDNRPYLEQYHSINPQILR